MLLVRVHIDMDEKQQYYSYDSIFSLLRNYFFSNSTSRIVLLTKRYYEYKRVMKSKNMKVLYIE